MKLRLKLLWRTWLFGIFWGYGDAEYGIPKYIGLHFGPLILMLEWKTKSTPPKPRDQMTKEDWGKFEKDCESK